MFELLYFPSQHQRWVTYLELHCGSVDITNYLRFLTHTFHITNACSTLAYYLMCIHGWESFRSNFSILPLKTHFNGKWSYLSFLIGVPMGNIPIGYYYQTTLCDYQNQIWLCPPCQDLSSCTLSSHRISPYFWNINSPIYV